MLHQPVARPVELDAAGRNRADRAMDVLQYGTALFAIVVAILLASFR